MYLLKNITAEQKVQEAARLIAGDQKQGEITKRSETLKVSRQTIYRWRDKGSGALQEVFSGEDQVQEQVEVERAVLTLYADGHASLEGIQKCIKEIRGVHVSVGRLSQIINEAADRAVALLPQMVPQHACDVALDEIFGRTPKAAYLNIVDVHSYMVLAASGPHTLDSETWQLLLSEFEERGGKINVTISDGGSSVCAAVGEFYPDRLHRRDIWHVFASAKKGCRKLSIHLGKRVGGQALVKNIEYLLWELREMVQVVVVRGGKLLGLSARMAEIREVLKLWVELEDAQDVRTAELVRQIRLKFAGIYDELIAFAVDVESEQEAVRTFLGEEALAMLGWVWQHRYWLGSTKDLVAGLDPRCHSSAESLFASWHGAVRASSAVENWHSILRPHLAVHRKFSPAQLALLMVWHNYNVFSRGEHKGKSPLELAGVLTEPCDWLVALGYGKASSPALKSSARVA